MGQESSVSEVKTGMTVRVGSTVSVVLGSGNVLTVSIRSPKDTDPEHGVISYESPLGKALIGKREGETLVYKVGELMVSARVIKIFEPSDVAPEA